MARESHRTPPTGSAFIRLLATMTDAQAPVSPEETIELVAFMGLEDVLAG